MVVSCTVVFSSCSQDAKDEPMPDFSSLPFYSNPLGFVTNDYTFPVDSVTFPGRNEVLSSRSNTESFTVYGFTRFEPKDTYKTYLSSDMRAVLGIPQQVYVAQRYGVYYDMTIPGLGTTYVFGMASSPLCGFDPYDLSARGYRFATQDEYVGIVTVLIHIISDIQGRIYDRWYPCRPEGLVWNYELSLR